MHQVHIGVAVGIRIDAQFNTHINRPPGMHIVQV